MTLPHDAIRQARERAGLTQEQLAERANLTAKTVYRFERGERLRPANERSLFEALGLSYEKEPEPSPGPIMIGPTDLLEDEDTRIFQSALKSEPQFLIRPDQEAWQTKIRSYSWWQAMGILMDRKNLFVVGLILLIGPLGAMLAFLADVVQTWMSEDITRDQILIVLFGVTVLTTAAYIIAYSAINFPYKRIAKGPCAVALRDDLLFVLIKAEKSVEVSRFRLTGATIRKDRYEGFVRYWIWTGEGESRRDVDLRGLPYDARFDRAVMAFQTGSDFAVVPIAAPVAQA